MKKSILLILILLISFFKIDVLATTNTYERTENNLLVPDYIEVNDQNKNNIMLTPAVDASEKIYDFADLFSNDEEKKLYDQILKYISKYNLDLAVVTIDHNNKQSASSYAQDFYDYNYFGKGLENSGLLFLIDMESREIYISTTGLAIELYNDYRIDKILDGIFNYMSRKEYYTGTSSFVRLVSSYADIDKSKDKEYIISNGSLVKDYSYIGYVVIAAIVITVIAILIMVRMNHLVFKASSSKDYLNRKTKKISRVSDVFLGSHVTKIRIDNVSSSGGGNSSGFSGSGSSGISHGGGGHRF